MKYTCRKNPDQMEKNLEIFSRFAPKIKQRDILTSNCVILTRVSSQDQEKNTSLNYQKQRCEEYAHRKGYHIVEYFGGNFESAKNDERKEFQRMIRFVKSSKDISRILVLSFDRFSRSGANAIYLISNLKALNIFVESVTQEADYSTPSGELLQNMQLLFSKLDNDQSRQKCLAGMQEMMKSGFTPGRAPVGYSHVKGADWDKRIILDEKMAPLIKKAFVMKAKEGKSNTEIAAVLAKLGLKASRKRLTEIFSNPFYAGILTSTILPGEVIQGKHPAIISEELFLKANDIALKVKHGQREQKEYLEFPLKQFVKCDRCGKPLTAYHVKRKRATYYKCNTYGCKLNRNTKILHDRFIHRLLEHAPESRAAQPIEVMMGRVFRLFNQSAMESAELLQKNLSRVEINVEKLTDKLIAEKISQEIYDRTLERYMGEKRAIQEKLPQLDGQLSNLDQDIKGCVQLSKNVYETWEKADLVKKQKIQNLMFPRGLRFTKEKDDYRTARTHFYFSTIALLSRGLAQKKSGTSIKKIENSALVPPSRPNMNDILEDTRDLARIWDLYGHLIGEH